MPNDTNQNPEPASTPKKPEVRADIAHVLETVKLPERLHKEYRAQGDDDLAPTQISEDAVAAANASVMEEVVSQKDSPEMQEFSIPSVHTLKDDLHSLVQGQELSMVKAAALEANKRSDRASALEHQAIAKPRSNTYSIIFVSIVLGLSALGTLVFLGLQFVQGGASLNATSTATAKPSAIMFTENAVVYPIGGLTAFDIKQQLASARSQDMRLGAIQRIVPILGSGEESREATTADFLSAIGAHNSDSLTRALSNEFLFGYHALSTNAPIFIIPVTSYERAFAGMLEWETTLPDDLSPIFSPVPAQTTLSDGTLRMRAFEDVTIQNYDIRVIRDSAQNVKLLYTFPSRSVLIIAENPISLNEILARLRAERRI